MPLVTPPSAGAAAVAAGSARPHTAAAAASRAAGAAASTFSASWQPSQRCRPELHTANGTSTGGPQGSLCKQQQQQQPGPHRRRRLAPVAAASTDNGMPVEDQSIRVKCMLAEGSGKLDLSECELARVPPAVCELRGLEELSLAGNQLSELPPEVSQLTALSRLQAAGNLLTSLPAGTCQLASLEGLWLHGNLLEQLPAELGQLAGLTQLSLSGNRLRRLPDSACQLAALRELSCAGNQLEALPEGIGALAALKKLSLHGNQLRDLPASMGGLSSLEELGLHGNPLLASLPEELGCLPALRDLSAADCGLTSVPASLAAAPALESLSLYGNQLQGVPAAVLQAPSLKYLWLEGNPLSPEAVAALLAALPGSRVSALGLDERQLAGAPPALVEAAAGQLRVAAAIPGIDSDSGSSSGRHGYFKLERAPRTNGGSNGNGSSGDGSASAEVLVVSFGSAPGTPNWGGLLKKVRAAAAAPQEQDFDVLYVVDPHRSWYSGGDEGYEQYERQLAAACAPYRHVIFIGDSMGATGALLFAHLATEVHAWTPQIDLATSSIRPAQDASWQAVLRERVLRSVEACPGTVVVHTGSWRHDLDQARRLPTQPHIKVQIYSVESHRLALALDRRGLLVQIVRSAVLQAMGLHNKENLRLANLF